MLGVLITSIFPDSIELVGRRRMPPAPRRWRVRLTTGGPAVAKVPTVGQRWPTVKKTLIKNIRQTKVKSKKSGWPKGGPMPADRCHHWATIGPPDTPPSGRRWHRRHTVLAQPWATDAMLSGISSGDHEKSSFSRGGCMNSWTQEAPKNILPHFAWHIRYQYHVMCI